MFVPDREFICIFGNQGCGKTVWAKHYAQGKSRLFVSDPMASYPGVNFISDPSDYFPALLEDGNKTPFRYGTFQPEELALFCHGAMAAGDCTLIIEECALIFKRGEELHEWFKPIVFTGRHRRVNLVLVAQRATKIPIDLRSQASRIITFRQTEPGDVNALGDRIGVKDDVTRLQKLECFDWQGDTGELRRYSLTP
jgi:hypothetical protein